MINDGLYSSKKKDWATPQPFFDCLDAEFHFELDPCATAENAKCEMFYTTEANGLAQPWIGIVFCNPPYGRQVGLWVEKAYHEAQLGAVVVCLLPSRTDTRWWHDWVMKAHEIRLVKGRLKFGGGKNSAPFPSAVVIFRPGKPETLVVSAMSARRKQ